MRYFTALFPLSLRGSAACIQQLKNGSSPDQRLVVYFYADSACHNEMNTNEQMLCSFIHQALADTYSELRTLKPLQALMSPAREEEHEGYGVSQQKDKLISVFKDMSRNMNEPFVIVDALDECNSEDLEEILRSLKDISSWHGRHLLITSRPSQVIQEFLQDAASHQLTCDGSEVLEDIRYVVRDRVGKDRKLKKLPFKLKEDIEARLCARSGASFLWATCQLEAIVRCPTAQAIHQSLLSIPSTLQETYSKRMSHLEESHGEIILKLLQWILYAKQMVRRSDCI